MGHSTIFDYVTLYDLSNRSNRWGSLELLPARHTIHFVVTDISVQYPLLSRMALKTFKVRVNCRWWS